MNLSAEGVQSIERENEKVRASEKALLEGGLSASGNFLLSQLERIESWLNGVVTDTNKKQLKSTNTLYLEWMGENSIRQQLALQGAAPFSSARIFMSILAEKCKINHGGKKQKKGAALSTRPDSLDQILAEKRKRESGKKGSGKK